MKRIEWVAVLASLVLVAAADRPRSPGRRQHVRQLATRYEGTVSAPDGPSGYVVAGSSTTWDSGWRALGLPGTPPAVDFSRELAVLKATAYGSSPFTYSSRIVRAELDSRSTVLTIHVRLNDGGAGVDTSSRKVVAAAISSASGRPPWQGAVAWQVVR